MKIRLWQEILAAGMNFGTVEKMCVLPAVPRVGDTVAFGDMDYVDVRDVFWDINKDDSLLVHVGLADSTYATRDDMDAALKQLRGHGWTIDIVARADRTTPKAD